MSGNIKESKAADGVRELVLAAYPTAQCIWTSRGWRVIAPPEGGGEVKELARTSSAHVAEIEAWGLAAIAIGIFEPPSPGSRGDIAGQRILPDGRVQYLMHNEALCEPYYLALYPPKPSAEQPEKLPESMALFLMNNCDGVSLDSIAVVARAVLRWQRCHSAMAEEGD